MKLEEDNQLAEEEIAKIRREFDVAKQSFFKIPDALKGMQKMDPNGILIFICLLLFNHFFILLVYYYYFLTSCIDCLFHNGN
ncbi:unnamed protein product [Camellia sinensis]